MHGRDGGCHQEERPSASVPLYSPLIAASSLVSVLIVRLSHGARIVLSYTRRMVQNCLSFGDSPIIPLRRSPLLPPTLPNYGRKEMMTRKEQRRNEWMQAAKLTTTSSVDDWECITQGCYSAVTRVSREWRGSHDRTIDCWAGKGWLHILGGTILNYFQKCQGNACSVMSWQNWITTLGSQTNEKWSIYSLWL